MCLQDPTPAQQPTVEIQACPGDFLTFAHDCQSISRPALPCPVPCAVSCTPVQHQLRHAGKEPEWFLEIDAGDIDTRADSGLNYVADPHQRRVTFAAAGGLWSLRFPTPETYRAFMTELEVGRVWGVAMAVLGLCCTCEALWLGACWEASAAGCLLPRLDSSTQRAAVTPAESQTQGCREGASHGRTAQCVCWLRVAAQSSTSCCLLVC